MRTPKGQSLIEVTVALSILGIAMMGLITLGINVIGYSLSAKARTQAIALAQEGLEVKRAGGGCSLKAESISEPAVTGFTNFQRVVTVAAPVSNQIPDGENVNKFWLITSTVSWTLKGTIDGEVSVYGIASKE